MPVCRDEPDYLLGGRRIDEAFGLAHDLERRCAVHASQPHPVQRERRHTHAEGLEIGQEILTDTQQNLVMMTVEMERCGIIRVRVNPLFQRGGRAAFRNIAQLLDEEVRSLRSNGIQPAERENLLELIEHEQRLDRAIPPVPEIVSVAMKILPERLAVALFGRLDLLGRCLAELLRRSPGG